jgi:hypothetical protein
MSTTDQHGLEHYGDDDCEHDERCDCCPALYGEACKDVEAEPPCEAEASSGGSTTGRARESGDVAARRSPTCGVAGSAAPHAARSISGLSAARTSAINGRTRRTPSPLTRARRRG